MPTPEEQKVIDDQKVVDDKAAADKAKADAEKKPDPLEEFNTYLQTLPEETRKTIEGHTSGLKTALVSERNLNKDSKSALGELQTFKEADAKRKLSEMSIVEVATQKAKDEAARATKAEADLREERVKNAIIAAAKDFADPNDAYTMIDRSALEIDEKTGKVSGIEDAIKVLVKAKPYLIKPPKAAEVDINAGSRGHGTKELAKGGKPLIHF